MPSLADRREFLHQSAAAAALTALGFAGAGAKDEAAVFPIIDTHQHLWDLGKFRLPWLASQPSLKKSYLPEDYRQTTADLPGPADAKGKIVKTIYMEVDVDPAQQTEEAEYVEAICKKGDTPMVAAVISGRPASAEFKQYITRFKDSKYIKGVRQVLHNPQSPKGFCGSKEFIAGIRLLGELGMSFDLCMRPRELADAAKLIAGCPDTRFILDHCGNGEVQATDRTEWKRGMAAVAEQKNVVGKVSGIVAGAKPGAWTADDLAPIVKHTVEVFGKDRVMFGGDWPVCTLAATFKQWVTALQSIVADWPAEDQRKLFHDNAVRVYGLG
jgi:predicted TIM-barrel fold metal-dependent hydrolase